MSRNGKKESAELDVSALPSLPKGWCWTTVGRLGQWFGGCTPSKANARFWVDGSIPWISPKDMKRRHLTDSEDHITDLALQETNLREVPVGTVLVVVRSGILARTLPVAVAKVAATMNQDLKGIAPFEGVDSDYVAFYLEGAEHAILHSCCKDGTTVASIDVEALRREPFPLAPDPEQRRIVAKIEELFSDLDAGVAALRRVRANLKRYRAAVLKAAVEGRLTAAWRKKNRPKETGLQLLARILAERRRKWEQAQRAAFAKAGKTPPAKWKDKYKEPAPPDCTNLPPLPDGWCWATVDQLICRSEYGTSVKCSYDAGGAPVLRIPNIARGAIDLSDVKFSTRPLELDSENALRHGDLLVCRTNGSIGLLGKAALVRDELQPAHSFASYLLRFRLVVRETIPGWLHLYLSSQPGRVFIEGHAASSAGQHNISLSLMHRMPIPLPPLSEQSEILYLTEDRLALMGRGDAQVEASLRRSARLRQSILRRAFEGKLVAQDPADGTASALLKRIREQAGSQTRARRPATKRAGRANVILD